MNGSSLAELRQARGKAMSRAAGWAGGLLAVKGRVVASCDLQPAAVSAGFGGLAPAADESTAPMLDIVNPQTADEPAADEPAADEPRPAPVRRRIRTAMRLDSERRRRLNLVAGFTGRTAQTVIVTALQDYLRDLISRPAAALETAADCEQSARASSLARVSQRSLRLHPHLYWRLAIAARKARCSMQSILIGALDRHLNTVAPAICAEVVVCLKGLTGETGTSTPRSKSRPAHWRAQSGRPLGCRRLRNEGVRRATPHLVGFLSSADASAIGA
ncbi:MAG: hypothetical protein O7I42_02310 [Alphaproteobacteria bacterium]|nr:hypothetical protein [Alphaproteobacteria bacterium]